MAKCLGPDSPYGCGHHTQHVEAAKKGWVSRRAGTEFRSSQEHGAVKALFGKDVTLAHEHPSHAGFTAYKSGGKWYEVPTKTFKGYAKHGRLLQEQQAKDAERQRREDEKNEREYQREVAKVEKQIERHKAQEEKKKLAQRYQEERDRLKFERQREQDEQRVQASSYAQYEDVVHAIRRQGGIRPDKVSSASSKGQGPGKQYLGLSEWQALPRSVRTFEGIKGRKPQPLDDVAQSIAEEFPDLPIGRGDDLARYLENPKFSNRGLRNRQHMRRGITAPAPKPAAPKVVISQKKNGEWIINRLYPDGEVRGDPGTYASKAAAEKAASSQRAAGAGVIKPAMFGEEQQRKETYGEGLFG